SRKYTRAAAPEAVNALMNMVRDPDHRDHARAVAMLLDRADPIETRHNMQVIHKVVDADQEAIEELRAARALGASRRKLPELFGGKAVRGLEGIEAGETASRADAAKVIDGDAVEVS